MKNITIIGAGASGTLLAVNLLRFAEGRPLQINIVERRKAIGRGVAYSTAEDVHFLNVPAGKMGAFPEDVEHFHTWLNAHGYSFSSGDFVPRRIYGDYLREVFAEAISTRRHGSVVRMIDDEAVDADVHGNMVNVMLKSGASIESDNIVLAFGNFLPPPISVDDQSFVNADKFFADAWDPANFLRVDPQDHIVIVGTGLTAVDNILALADRKHRGKITAISTHGWLPAVHAHAAPYPSFAEEIAAEYNIRGIVSVVRQHCKEAENWRSVIDSLRPITQMTWMRLNINEKRRFMRHARRVWDVSRHRMPPQCAQILQGLQDTGQLQIIGGRIKSITALDMGFEIAYAKRGVRTKITADAVFNCIGSESNYGNIEFPLVRNLMDKGSIKTDELCLGLAALPNGTLLDAYDNPRAIFRTIGTALKGVLWESTAMPEIRLQARDLALDLLAE